MTRFRPHFVLVIAAVIISLACAKEDAALVQLVKKDYAAFLSGAAEAAAQAVTKTLNSRLKTKDSDDKFSLQEADLDTLKVWQGQAVDVSLDVGGQPHRFMRGGPEDEAAWTPVRRILPISQGGDRLRPDWDALEAHLARPLRDGATLADFTLEGPLDIFFSLPVANLQLWLPHSAEAGAVRRVLLREGAAVTVRGALAAALRRPVDLPSVSLSDFVAFATEDKERKHAAGLMHLAAGLRDSANRRWNASTPKELGTTPALVGLELDFGPGGVATLFAAPDPEHGALARLRVRRLGDGLIELARREGGAGHLSAETSKALALKPASPYMWPLRSAAPETMQAYEGLLREMLASQVFTEWGTHAAEDVPLTLRRSAAEAVTLLSVELAVTCGSGKAGESQKQLQSKDPPTPGQLLTLGMEEAADGAAGKREVWAAVVRVEGSAREGLRFKPVGARLVERTPGTTATFAPDALLQLAGELGLPGDVANRTMAAAAAVEHDEL